MDVEAVCVEVTVALGMDKQLHADESVALSDMVEKQAGLGTTLRFCLLLLPHEAKGMVTVEVTVDKTTVLVELVLCSNGLSGDPARAIRAMAGVDLHCAGVALGA